MKSRRKPTAPRADTNPSSRHVVYAALVGNLLVAATKAIAAALTGSSAMLSEAVHSVVDSVNEILLLYGQRQAARRADTEHPFGHGRELYFWSFIVALLIFAVGAGVSVYQGIAHIRSPEPIRSPHISYVVLALAFVFEGASWLVSLRQFRAAKGHLDLYEGFRSSKDPPSFLVLFEDSAALIGIVLAALGTFAATTLEMPVADGTASVLIGLVLGSIAVLLARESKSLLIGEAASPAFVESVLRIASEVDAVVRANGVLTAHMAPDQVVVALSVEFKDDLKVPDVEDAILEIEKRVREAHPEVIALFVKPQTPRAFRDAARKRFGDD